MVHAINRVLAALAALLLLAHSPAALAQNTTEPEAAAPAASLLGQANAELVASAVDRYYRMSGALPASWQAVLSAGVFDNELTGPSGQPVNPDDGKLDFPEDVYLEKSGKRLTLYSIVNGKTSRRILHPGHTYATQIDHLRSSRNLVPKEDARIKAYKTDMKKLLQFAQIGQLNDAIAIYHARMGMYPLSVAELLDSGLSPITRESLNPVTGQPYRFDGSPGNLRLNAATGFSAIIHVDEDGLISTELDY